MGRSAAKRPALGSARRAAVVLALAAALAGCGGAAGGAVNTVTPSTTAPAPSTTAPPSTRLDVTALEYHYDVARAVNLESGEVTIALHNQGTEPHHGQLLRLHDGVTDDDIANAVSDDPSAAPLLDLGAEVGGPGMVAPGGTSQMTERLAPGSYLMFCLVRAPSGETHAIDGMVAEFNVTDRRAAAGPPRAVADLRLTDAGFRLPSPFPRHGVLRVTNRGKQAHEVTFLALPPGRGRDAIDPYLRSLRNSSLLQSPPPLKPAGGVAALSPGGTATVPTDLPSGSYLAICLVRGPDGEPHALHGMVQTFTVR